MPAINKNLAVVVLAGGHGRRMKSALPKVLHEVGNKPMIVHTLDIARQLGPSQIIVVANRDNLNLLKNATGGKIQFAVQKVNEGTAAAVSAAIPYIETENVAIMYGDDTAFYKPKTIESAYKEHKKSKAAITFFTLFKANPQGLGRIVRQNNKVSAIVEERDATRSQKEIDEVSDGLYLFNSGWLKENIFKLTPSPVTGEYYLTDLINLALKSSQKVETFTPSDPTQWHGINSPKELKEANYKLLHKIHVMGIGGAGASALSAIAREAGYEVSGCDLNPDSAYKDNLKGIDIKKGHDSKHLHGIGQLILSEAILKNDPNNSEVAYARQHKVPILLWEQFQANVLQKDKFVIAVAGAYGKSTTTAMVSKVLIDAGLDPTCEIGAKILEWGINYRVGKSKYYVCEVDEYFDKFHNYSPDLAIILNLGWDHPDYFKTKKNLVNSYKKFVQGVKPGGTLIIPEKLIPTFKPVSSHLKIVAIKNYGTYKLDIIGNFRAENANAAMTLASQLGIKSSKAKKSIESFKGTGRRLEFKGKIKGVPVYDDYAVQPYTVLKTANAIADKFSNKKMVLVFEPHTFSRINKFFDSFVKNLKKINAAHIYITSVYPAREKGDVEKLSKEIAKAVGPKATYSGSIEQTAKTLKSELGNYQVVLSMGAGNVYQLYDQLNAIPR